MALPPAEAAPGFGVVLRWGRLCRLGGWRGLVRVPRTALAAGARRHREFPLLNTPHAFARALEDTLAKRTLLRRKQKD